MNPDDIHAQRDPPRPQGYGDTEWHAEELAEAMNQRLAKEREQEDHEQA